MTPSRPIPVSWIVAAFMAALAFMAVVVAKEASAAPGQAAAIGVSLGVPAQLANPRHASITCASTTNGTAIQPSSGSTNFRSYRCQVDPATPTTAVFVGGNSGLSSTSYGGKFCSDTVACFDGAAWGADGAGENCFSVAGTIVIRCRFFY